MTVKTTENRRATRMGDQILRELATMIEEDFQDPRLNLVTISGVRLNRDMSIAEVFFTLSGGEERRREAGEVLTRAAGRLRSGLGRRLKMRYIPELRFTHDAFLEDMVYGKPAPVDRPDHS